MEMMADDYFSDAISWLPNGHGFIILNRKKFSKEVLPKYFKKTKFVSFTRKLIRWGFQRVTEGPEKGCYYHALFQKNNLELCARMSCDSKAKSTLISAMPKVGSQRAQCNHSRYQSSSPVLPANINGFIHNGVAVKRPLTSTIPLFPRKTLLNIYPMTRDHFLPPSSFQKALIATQTAMAIQAAKQSLLSHPSTHLLALKACSAASRKLLHTIPTRSYPSYDNLCPSTNKARAA